MFTIEIIEDDTAKAVKTMTASGERQAKRIADGASINLNHDRFYVRVTDEYGDEIY